MTRRQVERLVQNRYGKRMEVVKLGTGNFQTWIALDMTNTNSRGSRFRVEANAPEDLLKALDIEVER